MEYARGLGKMNFIIGQKSQSLLIGLSYFFFSYVIFGFYEVGDLDKYNQMYLMLEDQTVDTAFGLYYGLIGSMEPIHFLLTYIFSNIGVERVIFFSVSNAILAYTVSLTLFKLRIKSIFIFLFVFTNFYVIVLATELERLKFALIFLLFAFYFSSNSKIKFFCIILSFLCHIQSLVLLAGFFCRDYFSRIHDGKLPKAAVLVSAILLPILVVLGMSIVEHIVVKFDNYLLSVSAGEVIKFVPLFAASLFYSIEKWKTFLLWLPLICSIILFGGDRLNIFAFVIFCLILFKKRRGMDAVSASVCGYFSVTGLVFIFNIFTTGRGYAL